VRSRAAERRRFMWVKLLRREIAPPRQGNAASAPSLQSVLRALAWQPRWLLAAWAALLCLGILTVTLNIAGAPVYFAHFSTLCANCSDERLTPADAQSLHAADVSITAYATYWTMINLLFTLVYCGVALFIVWRKPCDRITGVAALALFMMGASFPDIPVTLAATHPFWRLPVTLLTGLGLPSLVAFLFVFPTGRFAPGYSRWVAFGFSLLYLAGAFFSVIHASRLLNLLIMLVVFGSLVLAQIYRYRRVLTPVERQQTKWVVFGVTIALIGFLFVAYIPLAALQFFPSYTLSLLPFVLLTSSVYLLLLLIPLAIAIAILRYRLWDIDLIVNRTLVYGLLTIGVVGSYALLVVSLDALLRTETNFLISLFAAGVIAVFFQPLRERLQRAVNRLLYGQRDEPYAVIARLSQRLKETLAPDAVLSTITETVAQALKLPYVAIRWKQGETLELAASYGAPVDMPLTLPLVYQSETIGQLELAPRSPGEAFTPADARLLDELARQAGLAAHAVRLADDLQKARERLVLAHEEERRRLRRDLHDGVGPTLASLSQRIDTATRLVRSDPDAAIVLLSNLKAQVKSTIADIRRVVYALRPPILDELGLVSAIREHASQLSEAAGFHVLVEAPADLPVLSAAVEVAAYHIILESLTNVERHANAPHCAVRLKIDGGQSLQLVISDDGCGLPDTYHAGVGMTSIRERVAELGGVCSITAQATGGVCVFASLPLKPEQTMQ